MPKIASESITRVCVRNLHTTRVGGSFACADFHVTPPFGSSIVARYARQAALYVVVKRVNVQRLRNGRWAGDWLGVSWSGLRWFVGIIRKERGLCEGGERGIREPEMAVGWSGGCARREGGAVVVQW